MKRCLVIAALCFGQMAAAQFSLGIGGGYSKPIGEFGQLNPADPADGMALDGWQARVDATYFFNPYIGLGIGIGTSRNSYESALSQKYLQEQTGNNNLYFVGGAYQSLDYSLGLWLGYGNKTKTFGIYLVPQLGSITMLPQKHTTTVVPNLITTQLKSGTALLFGGGLEARWYITKGFGLGLYANYLLSSNLSRVYETKTEPSGSSSFEVDSKAIQSLNLGLSLYFRIMDK